MGEHSSGSRCVKTVVRMSVAGGQVVTGPGVGVEADWAWEVQVVR